MIKLKPIIILFIVFPTIGFADLITIKTTNGKFDFPKEMVLNGPDGVMKTALKNSSSKVSTLEKKELFFFVDKESMRIALHYIRSGNIAEDLILKSSLLRSDIEYLFPGIKLSALTPKKKIWECGAYCYEHDSYEDSVKLKKASDLDIFIAWQKLNKLCSSERYVKRQLKNTSEVSGTPSMRDACVEIEK